MTGHNKRLKENSEFWQWNCRGFRRKKGLLEQMIQAQSVPPVAIALQETGTLAKISGYETLGAPDTQDKVATLIRKGVTAIQHKTQANTETPHVLTEILCKGPGRQSIFF